MAMVRNLTATFGKVFDVLMDGGTWENLGGPEPLARFVFLNGPLSDDRGLSITSSHINVFATKNR